MMLVALKGNKVLQHGIQLVEFILFIFITGNYNYQMNLNA